MDADLPRRPLPGRSRSLALVISVLSLSISCSQCGAPAAKDASELLPAQWSAALTTAQLGLLAQRLNATTQLAAQIPGGEILGENVRALSSQLGVELLSREGLVAAGLDPDRGAAMVLLDAGSAGARPPWIAAFPLAHESVFAQKLESTLAGRAGYPNRADEARGNIHTVVFSRTGVEERVAYAVVRGYGVVARATDPSALIANAAAQKIEASLASDLRLVHARAELEHPDIILLSASGNPLLARLGRSFLPAVPGDSSLGLSLLPDGLLLRITQDFPENVRTQFRSLFTAPAADAFQTPQAPLMLRVSDVPSQLPALLARLQLVPQLGFAVENLRAALAKNGADLDRDLFGALSPGAALSVDLAPNANLGRALDPSAFDLRTRSPFDIVRVYAVAAARDPEAIRKGLSALAQALPALGATAVRSAEKKAVPGGIVDEWSTHYPGGEGLRFGLFVPGRDLCGPSAPARTQALVYALGGTGPIDDVLAQRLACSRFLPGDSGAAAVPPAQLQLDLGALAEEIGKLPDSAYGTGPQVFVARSLVSQIIVPMQRLRLNAELRPSDRGISASLHLRVSPQIGAGDPSLPSLPARGQTP